MSKRTSSTKRFVAGLAAISLVIAQLALPPHAAAAPVGSSTASAGSVPPPTATAVQSFQPDLFTGRATTSVPIAVPPGRKGMQPSLALAYSSSGRNSWVGVGWSLDVGYIERSTKNGVPKYDSTDTFAFMLQSVNSELVQINDGTYRAKDEGLFLRFSYQSGLWEVRDKSGTRYLFGQTPASQIQNSGKTFRWCLDQVIDTNGNTMALIYVADQGQLYLSQIQYTGHTSLATPPANEVDFFLDPRTDVETSYRSGFPVTTAKRLKAIEASVKDSTGVLSLARRHELNYTQSPRSGRSLLAGITPFGTDRQTSLPPTTFTYTSTPPDYLHCHNCVPSISSGNHGWALQYYVGHQFPHDDGGNDQRLWPGASWDPGIKIWNEKVCKRRLFGKSCHEEQRSAVIPTFTWSGPQLDLSGSSGGVSWSTDTTTGNLTASGPKDTHVLAMTWLYNAASGNASFASLGVSGHADVFYVQPGGNTWSIASGNQVPLSPGWTVVAITAYDEMGGFNLNISANPVAQSAAMNHGQFSPMSVVGDFNGDGYPDLGHFDPSTNHWHVLLNSPSGFQQEQTWLNIGALSNTVVLVGDVNSDGKTDLILWNSQTGQWQVALSTGTSFATPVTWNSGFGAGGTPFMGDFNGDGLLDVGTFSSGTWTVALSTGSSFALVGSFTFSWGTSGHEPLTGDFNGDGLTDLAVVDKGSGNVSVAFSNGSSFVPQATNWINNFGPGQSHTTADLNGDGLTDIVYYDRGTGMPVYAPSNSQVFGNSQSLMSDHPFGLRDSGDVLQVGDFGAKGMSGFGVFDPITGAAEIAFAMGAPPDLLVTVANGLGGATTITYRPSSDMKSSSLPFILPLVTQVDTSDGMGHTYTTTYTYAGGLYDGSTREFRGFQMATVTDAVGTTTTTTFAQDLHTKGRPLSVEVRDVNKRLYNKTVNAWSCTEFYPGVHFAKLDQVDHFVYDGDDSFKEIRTRFTYDAQTGNITTIHDDGQVDPMLTGYERTTITTYALNTSAWILNKPSLIQTFDASGVTTVAQRRFTYDNAPDTTSPPAVGNLTKEESWLNLPNEQWLATTLTYDAYGNVTTVTDTAGRKTANTYDTTGAYLITITNALGHTRQLTYDPHFGQVTKSIDQNGQPTTTQYDALGRVTKVTGPNDTDALPTISYQYNLLSTPPSSTVVTTRIQSGQVAVLTVYTFTDGLGRTIQTRSPAEDSTKQVVNGAVEWDARGLVTKQWAPYLDLQSTSYVPPPTASLAPPVQYDYDPVGRVIRTVAPDGTETLVDYNDGETTTSVAGHQTQRLVDAFGRLIEVDEVVSDTEKYATTYQYDPLGNLIQVTDAQGNTTRIAYDSLGRKLSMDDPDMHHWTYTYDAVDNLKTQTDARGVTITFTYDALNRLTGKSYTIPASSTIANPGAVTYTYDDSTQPFAKGKLTGITDGSGSSSFQYDNLGRLIKETKTIDGTSYTIQRAYDLLGQLTSLTYPDNDVATYTYNQQGGIETVTLTPFGSPAQPIVTDIDYNAAGQLTKITYGNGTTTDYSYNPQTLRLDHLQTAGPAGTLQDFRYTFDPIGNVTQIQDAVHTASQTFQYDAFNRLTQAIGAYGTFTYAYDPVGNMLSKEGVAMRYGENSAGPHAVTSTDAGLSMLYDVNGNLIKKTIDARPEAANLTPQLLSYDAENRLVQAQTAQDQTASVTFHPGWNFFSLPVVPDKSSAVADLLPSFAQNFEQVAKYDPSTDTFKHYVGNAKFDDFSTLQYGVGYQAYYKGTSDFTVTFKGKLPTQKLSKPLPAGWSLVPSITLDPQPASWLTGGLSADQIVDATLKPVTQLSPGQAYYVHLTAAATFAPSLPRDPTTTFVYDGDGGRVKKITPGGTTIFLGQNLEKDPTGKTTKYIFAGSQRIASKDSTGTLQFYHSDHLGSSNVITDKNGSIVELAEYTPYGSLSRREGTANTAQKFTGQRLDAETGLYFFNARYYDPSIGRFITPDEITLHPSRPQGLNRYSYTYNNPVIYMDPSGHFAFLAFLIGAVIGGTLGGISAHQHGGSIAKGVLFGALAGGLSFSTLAAPAAPFLLQTSAQLSLASLATGALPGRTWGQISLGLGIGAGVASALYIGSQVAVGIGNWIHEPNAGWYDINGNPVDPSSIPARSRVYTNGILNDLDETLSGGASRNANYVFYNPTHGPIADLTESFLQKVTLTGSIDRQFAAGLSQIQGAIDVTAHSQGTITLSNALINLGITGRRLASGSSTTFLAGAISQPRAILSAWIGGASKTFYGNNTLDFINLAGPNLNPVKLIGGAIGAAATGAKYHDLVDVYSQTYPSQ